MFGQSLALAVVLATAALPALAEPAAPRQTVVATDGLDLAHPDGVRALYTRIHAAAREVCAPAAGRGAGQQVAWNACRREALDRAVATLGNDAVARLHASRNSRGTSPRPS